MATSRLRLRTRVSSGPQAIAPSDMAAASRGSRPLAMSASSALACADAPSLTYLDVSSSTYRLRGPSKLNVHRLRRPEKPRSRLASVVAARASTP